MNYLFINKKHNRTLGHIFVVKAGIQNFFLSFIFLFICLATVPENAFAAHPLITDDAGTQGKGGIQIELNSEYEHGKNEGVTEDTYEVAGMLTYGLIERLDLVLGIPYLYSKSKEDGETEKEKGISDATFEAKFRFLEAWISSFAIKPGISFPTGDYKKRLGTGKTGYSGYFINTINLEPVVFHINLGYIRNENKLDEEKNLWHGSLAAEYSILKSFRLVANVGMDKNTDPDASGNPAFLLGGFIYSPLDNFDLDAGFKYSLNTEIHYYSLLAGLTVRI